MRKRPGFAAVLALAVWMGLAVLFCFGKLGSVTATAYNAAALCGGVAAMLCLLFPGLPATVVALLVSFLPAIFIPEAYFIGLGIIFIVVSVAAGGIFDIASAIFSRIAERGRSS